MDKIASLLTGSFMFPGMPEDQQRAAAMRMAMGVLAHNTESRPGAGDAFGRAMSGGMDEGALYANNMAQQARMAQQVEMQKQQMEQQRQQFQAEQEERLHVKKYYGLASEAMARGDMQGVMQNVSQANPAMGFNMAFQQMQNKQAQAARGQERSEDRAWEQEKIKMQHEWHQDDMRLQKQLAAANIAAARSAGEKPTYIKNADGSITAVVGTKGYPVTMPDGSTGAKATVGGVPVGQDGNLEYQAPEGRRVVPMPKPPNSAQLYAAQQALGEAESVIGMLREQQALHALLSKKYGTGWSAQLKMNAADMLKTDSELTRYRANSAALVQKGLALQKGPQTDADFLREAEKYSKAHYPEAAHAGIIKDLIAMNERTINNTSAFMQGKMLVPENAPGTGTPKTTESGVRRIKLGDLTNE